MPNTLTDVVITDKNITLFPLVPSFEGEFSYTQEIAQNFAGEFSQYGKEVSKELDVDFQKIMESNPSEAKKFMSAATLADIQRFFNFVEHKDIGREIHRFPFFNNFHTKFPGGQFWESVQRINTNGHPLITEPLIQVDPESIDEERNSEKYAQQSLGNFFADLQATLGSSKKAKEKKEKKIRSLIQKRVEARLTPQYHEIDTELHKVLLPLYYMLREQGYSHGDLD